VTGHRRVARVLLRCALPLALIVAGAAAVALYRRAHFPLVVFETGVESPWAHLLDDGRFLLVGGERMKRVELWSVDTGEHVRTIEDPECGRPIWANVSERAAVIGFHHILRSSPKARDALRFVSAETGRDLGTLTFDHSVEYYALSPRGDLVAVCDSGVVQVWKTPLGPLLRSFAPPPEARNWFLGHPVFSPEGDRLTVPLSSQDEVAVLSITDGSVASIVSGGNASFDERRELVVLQSRTLEVLAADGRLARTLPQCGNHFQTGGTVYASTDSLEGPVDVRSLETGELKRRIPFEADHWWFLLSPLGDRLAIVHRGGRIEIWEIPP
jgi:WD40 repeat protein